MGAASWALLLNPFNEMLNHALQGLHGLHNAVLDIYSIWGMIFVEGLLNMPITYLIIAPAMASFDVSLEESSRVSGAGIWKTLLRVTLPVLRPAILAAFVGATLGVVLSLFIAYVVVKICSHASGLLEMLTFLAFSFLGIVIGIGFIWFFVQTPLLRHSRRCCWLTSPLICPMACARWPAPSCRYMPTLKSPRWCVAQAL